ncbi:MAG: chromosomal replication initiator protein DnaA [Acidobacteria bacterium 13_1_20CM_4_56_7]|nr:MAG: chromosomal replication initiator protein DnaA [Acidobacteria bacterium 13_1_20CM_4_56_7]PYV49139.1 MAG: chromosomal replication initiator protein DnaA [Acidobacteriota bacterium]
MSVPTPTLSPNPWLRILDALEKKINRHSYDTWLKPTRYSHSSNGIMYVRVPTVEFRHVGDKYADLIQEALDNLNMDYRDVEFVTPDDDPAATPVRHDGGLSAPQPAAAGIHVAQSRFDWDGAAQLNARYTFDGFVIGSGNQFAHAACQAVAQRPSKAYNPLFLYGGVGMGKTHLMQAIGHEVKRVMPQAAICYVSSEKFTNEMINSLRYDKMTTFRDKFRNVDVLLIDDIQFLAQKERTQEEFFHTFNALHESMKQIVIASDRSPKELAEIEDRLRSRFEWGLIADIQPPDLETKVAILQKKGEQERITLPTDVALFIASNIRSNVRELEGALIRLVAHSSLTNTEITLPYTQQVLKNFIDSQARKVTIESIQKAVAEQFGLRLLEIKAKNNSRAIVYPRQIAMYLAKHLTEASLPEIGRQFGGKHHTTVLHSVEKIEGTRKNDKDLNRMLNKLTEQLGG